MLTDIELLSKNEHSIYVIPTSLASDLNIAQERTNNIYGYNHKYCLFTFLLKC